MLVRTLVVLGAAVQAFAIAACGGITPQVVPVPADHADTMSYTDALLRIGVRQHLDDSVAVANGRTILMTHGDRAPRVYVLLHGFTDAPTQFATVGAHLFADGANVYIPRLPHHAERVSPLRAIGRVTSDELARFADSTTQIARGLGDTIVVVGLSAGGVLAGWITEHHPEVHRTVLIAPAIAPGRLPNGEGETIVILASKLPEVVRMGAPIDTARPENIPGITTRGLAELLRLGQRVRDQAGIAPPSVHDVVFLLNEADRTVSEEAALELAQRWTDRGATAKAYRFGIGAKLPHNVMELSTHGGNTELVYPIVEALARQGAAEAPEIVELLGKSCVGFWCRFRR
jgi:pimeloyl-ACP methyl ester carboxylesterase